ncbi:MAG: hypothetical protein M3O28_06980 [Actinomycetota bacterium]|nr:hypothetical protein [Actinomycetota bacterium]
MSSTRTRSSYLPAAFVSALGALMILAGCGAGSGSPTAATTSGTPATTSGTAGGSAATTSIGPPSVKASAPAAIEVNPAGDIPDSQAYVAYQGSGFTVTTPEGWARSSSGTSTIFSDKYNSVTVDANPSPQAPTVASAAAVDVPAIKSASPGFVAGRISTVQRKAGSAVLITYQAYSAVNTVTGKVAVEAIERYAFWRAGRLVTLTLSAPVGSDNVDPWRKVTDSFTWTN